MDLFDPSRVRQKLRDELGAKKAPFRRPPRPSFARAGGSFAQAGVLIPLFEQEGQMRLLMTRRNPTMRAHSGELSFPGGKRDPGDVDLQATALREAWEEVAIRPQDVEVFGAFFEGSTPSGFTIYAVVGEFPWPYELVASPAEVDYLLSPSLAELARPGAHSTRLVEHNAESFRLHHYEVEGPQPLWGATAQMVYNLLEFLGHLPPEPMEREV